jgi:hypothetical protein
MATTPSRNAGRQETYFYINRERPTSALGAGPRPHLNFAHLVRVRQQPPALNGWATMSKLLMFAAMVGLLGCQSAEEL